MTPDQTPPNLEKLLGAVRDLKTKGVKHVDLAGLESALVDVIAAKPSAQNEEWNKKLMELQHASKLAEFAESQETNRLLMNGMLAFAGAALKSALLINGGAAVAILAYIGNQHGNTSVEFPYSMLFFAGGVLLSAMATAASYMAQFYFTFTKNTVGNVFRGIAIALIVMAYCGFGLGCHTAYLGFIRREVPPVVSPLPATPTSTTQSPPIPPVKNSP